jgi:leucyl aminopeptidase
MQIEFVAAGSLFAANTAVAALVFADKAMSQAAQDLDRASEGALGRAVAASRFTGAKGQSLEVSAPHGLGIGRVILMGCGPRAEFNAKAAEQIAASAYAAVKASGLEALAIDLAEWPVALAAQAGLGVRLAAYRFDRYRTTEKPDKKPSVTKVQLVVSDPDKATDAFDPLSTLSDAVYFARDLISEPANILYPEEFARRVKRLEALGLEVEILGEKEMAALGMGSLLGVGQGSIRESQLAVIQWKGAADPAAQPLAFVGKGVCFDTGGISIKPADGMEDMKWDMGGAAAVAGLMHALAGRKAKVNVVGILGLVENMPGGNAQRPGDIVTSMSGKTIEVINTDAEGRLILADALSRACELEPALTIDLATLTGAARVALGPQVIPFFTPDEALARDLAKASETTGDALWRLPLWAGYEASLDSDIADLKNDPDGWAQAGAMTAALFLQRFAPKEAWVHLDIYAWNPRKQPGHPLGAEAQAILALFAMIKGRYA